MRKWRELFNELATVVKQNQRKHSITFDTELKTAPSGLETNGSQLVTD